MFNMATCKFKVKYHILNDTKIHNFIDELSYREFKEPLWPGPKCCIKVLEDYGIIFREMTIEIDGDPGRVQECSMKIKNFVHQR